MIKKRIKRVIILIIIIIVISAIAYFGLSKEEGVDYTTVRVEKGELIQTVSETGAIKSSSEINLNFTNTGKIAKLYVETGDIVKEGQILAELDYGNLIIKEKEAKANLNKLLAGATKEDIAVKQASVNQSYAVYLSAQYELERIVNTANENISQAEKTLNDLESNLPGDVTVYEQAVQVAQTSFDNAKKTYQQAINNKEDVVLTTIESELIDAGEALDTIDSIISDVDSDYGFSLLDTSYINKIKNSYDEAIILLNSSRDSLLTAKLGKTKNNIDIAINDAKNAIKKTLEALNVCFSALENSITSNSYTLTELTADKTSINTDLITILVSTSNIQTAEQNLDDARLSYDTSISDKQGSLVKAEVDLDNAIINARNSLNSARTSGAQQTTTAQAKVDNSQESWDLAKAQLVQVRAPARSEDVVLAQAALDTVKSQINDSLIMSPINGRITKVNLEIGEQANQTQPVISVLAENNFEIEVDISEADIAKVNISNLVVITLDAFGDDIEFKGKIYFIEPAETIIQDVIYYKVKVEFDINAGEYKKYSTLIKSGMTANIIITTNSKSKVLLAPNRAVIQKNGSGKLVRVLVDGLVQELPVTVGLRGDEGVVEILSGLKEGDEVVTFVKDQK